MNNTAYSLDAEGSTLYAGGTFTTAGGQSRSGLAAIGAADGLATAWEPALTMSGGLREVKITDEGLWAGGLFTITGSSTTNLAFFPRLHDLSVTVTGSGSVAGPGPVCSATCSSQVVRGSTVALTATPAAGQRFTGWSGACTGTGSCSVTMSAARSVTAAFAPAPDTGGTTPAETTPAPAPTPTQPAPVAEESSPVKLTTTLTISRLRLARGFTVALDGAKPGSLVSVRARSGAGALVRAAVRADAKGRFRVVMRPTKKRWRAAKRGTITVRVILTRPDGSRVRMHRTFRLM